MGLKEKLFIIFLVAVIFFPFFVSKKEIKLAKKINLPSVVVQNGMFYKYSPLLQRTGDFQKLSVFNESNYTITNLTTNLLEKNTTFISKVVTFNKIYHFKKGEYKTSNYIYLAKYGTYNDKNEILVAHKFRFFNDKIEGKGEKMTYKNNIITAENIKYTIKGLK